MEQTDKERIDGVIKNISINPANLEHIANTGRINGSLLVDLQIALTGEHNHVVQTQVIPLRERLEKVEKALKEARDVLVMASLIDKTSTCMDAVNEIDQLLTKEG